MYTENILFCKQSVGAYRMHSSSLTIPIAFMLFRFGFGYTQSHLAELLSVNNRSVNYFKNYQTKPSAADQCGVCFV
jgi:hypothetical protein